VDSARRVVFGWSRRDGRCVVSVRHAHGAPGRNGHRCTCRPDHLTDTELRIVVGLANGERLASIGRAVGHTETTVSTYIARARRKVGARTREQLVAAAMRDRLIGFDRDGRVVVVDELAERRAS
jgi:DNA-binding CsgD family transcriptional regulator